MNCRKCGAIVPDGSTNCSVCGAQIAPAANFPQENAAPVRPAVPNAAPAAPKRFCPQCGKELAANARFCGNCGANFGGGKPAAAPVYGGARPAGSVRTPVAPKPASKPNFLKMITNGPSFTVAGFKIPIFAAAGAGVILLVIILLAVLLLGGRGPEAAAEDFVDAMFTGDAEEIMDLLPDEMIEYVMDDEDMDEDEMTEMLQESLDELLEYYEDYDIEYKGCEIKSVKDMKKSKFRDLEENYEDEFDMTIDDAKTVKVKVTIERDGDKDSNTMEIIVIKVGGSYYVDMSSLDSIL